MTTLSIPDAVGPTAAPVTWLLCDLKTGRKLATLPILADDTLKYRIAVVDQTTVQLPLADPSCPVDWLDLLSLGRTMLVLALGDEPAQAWFVETGTIGAETVPLNLKSLETCLERTNVPTYDQGTDDNVTAAAALCEPLVPAFGFTVVPDPTGARAGEGFWDDTEDRSILDALNELMASGLLEWRIRLLWADHTHRQVSKVIELGVRIGVNRPHIVFDRDAAGEGNIETYTRLVSYAPGKGATAVQGVGDGSGAERPMTGLMISALVAQGWPLWSERKQFTDLSPDAVDLDVELGRRTYEYAATRERGTVTWELTCTPGAGRPGRDFEPGDSMRIDIAPSPPLRRPDGSPGPRVDPVGGRVGVRLIGWEHNIETGITKPTLWQDDADG